MTTTQIKFELSKTVSENGKNTRQKVGELAIYCPVLSEFGIAVEPVDFDKETGEANYASQEHQFLYSAILQSVKTAARNKFQPGTTDLRIGAKIAENLAELVAPSVSNKGAALVEKRALIEMFKAFLTKQGKNEAVQRLLTGMLERTDNLLLQDADKRGKIKGYFVDFGNEVGATLSDWQIAYLGGAVEACDQEEMDF